MPFTGSWKPRWPVLCRAGGIARFQWIRLHSVVAQTLRDDFSHVVIDAKAHVSLRDASRFFACPVLEFNNCDPADLRRVLAGAGGNIKPILLTDGVFTHDVKVAPLAEYLRILGPHGMILLDDAHGAGVVGRTGRGTLEYAGVSAPSASSKPSPSARRLASMAAPFYVRARCAGK